MSEATENTATASPPGEPMSDRQRVIVTVTAGIAGVILFVLGAVFAIWSYAKNGFDLSDWKFWVGYGSMLVSIFVFSWLLQWNRDLERVNPAIRRTLYGYNIFLSTVFLAAILILGNILITQYGHMIGLKASYDWTSQGVFTLQDVSKQQVKSLSKPVKIIALYQRRFLPSVQLEQLFKQYSAVNKDLTFEFVDIIEDRLRTEDLFKKYPDALVRGSGGFVEPVLIVTFGTGEDSPHKVVRDSEIFKVDTKEIDMMTGARGGDRSFFGENAVTSAIRALVEDKKTSVLFTAGHGEKDLNNSDERELDGIGLLKQRLTDLNIKVEPINLIKAEIPTDTDILVIAGPKSEFETGEVQKIRDFMERRNKDNSRRSRLLVLFDSPRESKSGDAGLGELLAGYKVQVKNNLVYDFASAIQRADQLVVQIEPEGTLHQIVAPLKNRWVLMIRACEIAAVSDARPPGMPGEPPGGMQATKLLQTSDRTKSWAEEDFESRPNPDKAGNTPGPVSLGVAVSEGGSAPPPMPGHPPTPSKSTPVAVVFGDATFASNNLVAQKPENEDLFLNAINWLGGRTADIGIQPRVKKYARLDIGDTAAFALIFEPFFHLVAIAGFLAALVWVARSDRFQLLWLAVGGTLVLVALYTGLCLWQIGPGPTRATVFRVLMTCIILWTIGLTLWLARMRPARADQPA